MEENQTPAQPQSPKSGNNTMMIVIAVLVVALLGGGGYFFMNQNKMQTQTEAQPDQSMTETSEQEAENKMDEESTEANEESSDEDQEAVKTFEVDGDNFSFSVKEIKVKKGDTVRIVFNNKEGFHDWVVDEFDARTKQIAAGKSETIEFVADKTGTFEYYCSVGAHRQNGMVGSLIVE